MSTKDYFAIENDHFDSIKKECKHLNLNELIKSQEKLFFSGAKKAEPDRIIDDCNTPYVYGFQQVVFLNEKKALDFAMIRKHSHSNNCIDMHIIQEDKKNPGKYVSQVFCVLQSTQEAISEDYQWATYTQNGSKLYFNQVITLSKNIEEKEENDDNKSKESSDMCVEEYKVNVIEFDLVKRTHKIV